MCFVVLLLCTTWFTLKSHSCGFLGLAGSVRSEMFAKMSRDLGCIPNLLNQKLQGWGLGICLSKQPLWLCDYGADDLRTLSWEVLSEQVYGVGLLIPCLQIEIPRSGKLCNFPNWRVEEAGSKPSLSGFKILGISTRLLHKASYLSLPWVLVSIPEWSPKQSVWLWH